MFWVETVVEWVLRGPRPGGRWGCHVISRDVSRDERSEETR